MSDKYPSGGEPFHGRDVWSLGEEGEWGAMVEGHDTRAWAALNAYARSLDAAVVIDLHSLLDGPTPSDDRPKAQWMTWNDECGCTPAEHEQHAETLKDEGDGGFTCWDITDRRICDQLPPCVPYGRQEIAWMPEFSAEPAEGAVPVLLWRFS